MMGQLAPCSARVLEADDGPGSWLRRIDEQLIQEAVGRQPPDHESLRVAAFADAGAGPGHEPEKAPGDIDE
jgi:hypothetical protein